MSSVDHFLEIELQKARDHQQKLEQLKKLAADPEMFRLMKQLVAKVNGAARVEGSLSVEKSPNGPPSTDHATNSVPNGLTDEVTKIVKSFGSNRFGVPDIKTRLDEVGFELRAKEPRSALGSVMDRLRRRGVVRLVTKGKGGSLNVYENVNK
jgi:hypothetical protein